MSGSKPLTPDEKHEAFCRATSHFAVRYAKEIEQGMTNDQLEAALKDHLGIFGGSGARDIISVEHTGVGLKIWGSWGVTNHCVDKPLFAGSATIKMARYVYNIAEPGDTQLPLL